MAIQKPTTIKYTKLFINNEFVDAASGKTFDIIDPSTEEVACQVSEADKDDIDLAVAAANKAFKLGSEWRTMDASGRGRLINKLADLIEQEQETLIALESMENGKPLCLSRADVGFAVGTLRYYAGFADKIHGDTIPSKIILSY